MTILRVASHPADLDGVLVGTTAALPYGAGAPKYSPNVKSYISFNERSAKGFIDKGIDHDELWVTTYFRRANMSMGYAIALFDTRASDTTPVMGFGKPSSPASAQGLGYWTGSAETFFNDSSMSSSSPAARIDLHCKLHATEGRFALYVDGTLVREYTGNTLLLAGAQRINRIEFIRASTLSSTSDTYAFTYSAIMVADEPTLDLVVVERQLVAQGTPDEWEGATVNDLRPPIPDVPPTNILETEMPDRSSFYTYESLLPYEQDYGIRAVAVTSLAREENAGRAPIRLAFASASEVVYEGEPQSAGEAFAPVQSIIERSSIITDAEGGQVGVISTSAED